MNMKKSLRKNPRPCNVCERYFSLCLETSKLKYLIFPRKVFEHSFVQQVFSKTI